MSPRVKHEPPRVLSISVVPWHRHHDIARRLYSFRHRAFSFSQCTLYILISRSAFPRMMRHPSASMVRCCRSIANSEELRRREAWLTRARLLEAFRLRSDVPLRGGLTCLRFGVATRNPHPRFRLVGATAPSASDGSPPHLRRRRGQDRWTCLRLGSGSWGRRLPARVTDRPPRMRRRRGQDRWPCLRSPLDIEAS